MRLRHLAFPVNAAAPERTHPEGADQTAAPPGTSAGGAPTEHRTFALRGRGVYALMAGPVIAGDPVIRWLAALPFLGMLIGPFFLNRVQPLVLGMPLLLAWLVMWVVLTSAIMAVIYAFDPANRQQADGGGGS
jgi:hypothetical protein